MRISLFSSTACLCVVSWILPSVAFHVAPSNRNNIAVQTLSGSPVASTVLKMGMFEDFVSGQDKNVRQQENAAYLQQLQTRVERINALESSVEELGDDELMAKTQEFRQRLSQGEDINGKLLEEAFAVVREASWRVLELRHYDVQLLGGLILHDGRLAEMATGEGKTLVSTLPAYVNALTGQTSFVITVNDYLARRDMEKMGQIHRFLGLTVGLVQANMNEQQRKQAYACDIVYVTNSELGFDYLRDHLALSPEQTVLPGGAGEFSGFCVVDEADSVLIDEARTPLIVSKQVAAPANKYAAANAIAGALKAGLHYTVDLKNKNCVLTEVGFKESEAALGVDSLFSIQADGSAWAPYITNAVKAKELFNKDVEYTILKDGSGKDIGVGIIDSFTGRVLDGRRWSDGLHQSIEAKEGIEVSQQSKVIAKVTYQALFRQFSRLSGMTGTAMSDAQEFEQTYGLKVVPVPTALPIARRDYPDVSFKTRAAANRALVKEVVNVGGGQPGGRPCLIGTTSVAQSEELIKALEEEGIEAELLNASPQNAPRESEIIAQAGRAGVVTVATNMAGRGTDILLGGCPTTMARIKTRSVLLEEGVVASKEELALVPPSPDEDYYPADVDEDAITTLKDAAKAMKRVFADGVSAIELDDILTVAFDTTEADDEPEYVTLLREAADSIKETFKEVLADEKAAVKAKGGLYVMGTNRHESSRIDLQLRGRAGRQGDPGSSRFFLSFEDDMFVIFGGDKLKNMLNMFRVSEDMPVEAEQVTEALNKVQNAVEEKYREIRAEIFNFDDVLNSQRSVIYKRRRDILFSSPDESLRIIKEYNMQTVSDIVKGQTDKDGTVNVSKLLQKVYQFFPLVQPFISEDDLVGKDKSTIETFVKVAVEEVFNSKLETQPNLVRSANYATLVTMDNAWSDHLQAMENLKESVILLKYQNRDPVSEYKNQSFNLFKNLEDTMRRNAVFSLWQSLAASGQPATQTA
ncbi:preprotein translocase subunit SecA [Fistulifera solaris]|uniref:Protein translocase subunit SecA n=1 Tax=Fistulifera solaris TaxID=1519565 RepID=A0A1Z5K2W9_FISSO|nr:preprotein translocase subunit SecA [Fistulifera solaris]|eukprot:GAX20603.1 preprotein translocase subunit SecA [Fistulifera solaris]